MFRRKPKAKVAEAFFPADLKQLGYVRCTALTKAAGTIPAQRHCPSELIITIMLTRPP